jgi:hypothetical protein
MTPYSMVVGARCTSSSETTWARLANVGLNFHDPALIHREKFHEVAQTGIDLCGQ